MPSWTPQSWLGKPNAQPIDYEDGQALGKVLATLRTLPPLVTSWEVLRLRALLADAERGRRFVLQGGDCAETFDDCSPAGVTSKMKILLQMSLVLIHGSKKPVVRVGRFAGQYAKPRSSPTERQGGVELPSYRGDLVNRRAFEPRARATDPSLLLEGYKHAALTLNFVRSLVDGGFADLHHPEYWDLSFLERADVGDELRAEYRTMSRELAEAVRFTEALGEKTLGEMSRVEFFTSHEGLNLHYESAQTRTVPRREGYFDLTTHLPWVGERTRDLDGAHVEFFRGVRNPVGVKVGPGATGDEVLRLLEAINPDDEAGKVVVITRMGAGRAEKALPPIAEAVKRAGRRALFVCDPMHGNSRVTQGGLKTRDFGEILRELELSFDVHQAAGTVLGGVHFELTGDDVTECIGAGLTEADLDRNYASLCDPRLNYAQALEMAFRVARKMGRAGTSIRPPV